MVNEVIEYLRPDLKIETPDGRGGWELVTPVKVSRETKIMSVLPDGSESPFIKVFYAFIAALQK